MRIVLTGKCHEGGRVVTRPEVTRRVAAAGYTVHPTVDGSTNYLVASRTDTRKAARAEALGVPTITYDQLFALVANNVFEGDLGAGNHRRSRFALPLPDRDGGRMTPQEDLLEERRAMPIRAPRRTTAVAVPTKRALDL